MHEIDQYLSAVDNWVWGPPLLILLIGTGIYLTIILRGVQFRYLLYAFKQAFGKQRSNSEGDISQYEALMTSLAGAIGTGTIVGVSTAIVIGGLGSMFWMWVTAFISMATKYAESLLAVKYRIMDDRGEMVGGPMQYIERGLGWKWMAMLFAFFASIAAIGTGNLLQVNAIAETVNHMWGIDPLWSGIVLAIIVGAVLIGGVKSIGHIAGVIVPFMALFYMIAGMIIIAMHIDKFPAAISLIISSAFNGQAAFGGFAGATLMMAVQMGVARSVISNEAGLGISSIAAAAAKTDNPGRQAMITMTGALLSTVVVCSITGLVLAVTEVLGKTNDAGQPLNGASMAIHAFSTALTGGDYVVSLGLIFFAFTTVIAWGYYGEKCCEYLIGERSIIYYRTIYALIIIPGSLLQLETVWYIANIFNGLMAIPNLIALVALSGVIVAETKFFLKTVHEEENAPDLIVE
ncbi:MAG: sodium:alanine symporter family protein [Parachlamydiaceae bacterium]|nr:sodium:alanine symporter family protein [Parachlamydiaceae bacterium]